MVQNLPRTKSHGRGVGGTTSAPSSRSRSSGLRGWALSPTQSVDTDNEVQSNERAARGIGATWDDSVAGTEVSPAGTGTVARAPTFRSPRPGGSGNSEAQQDGELDLLDAELGLE
jgi:hypothetical protein